MTGHIETIEELRNSFFYGTRSNLNFKFVANLSDEEFGEFLDELFETLAETTNTGDATEVTATVNTWQVRAYAGKHETPEGFAHQYDTVPFTRLAKPLSECRVALLTSSGHFVAGDDPEPFGVVDMTQLQAEARIHDFLRESPVLSSIPFDTPVEQLRVRHPGYPTQAAISDHGVNLPLKQLLDLERDGTIGQTVPDAYSFVGAASQLRLKKQIAPEWAERLRDEAVDLVLLVPV
ncbi:MAG: glycine/sarcosine/betaine reductase selenoprotein B family protein [Acidimicrobiales bacterium]